MDCPEAGRLSMEKVLDLATESQRRFFYIGCDSSVTGFEQYKQFFGAVDELYLMDCLSALWFSSFPIGYEQCME